MTPEKSLSGLKVVELSTAVAGPYAAMMLGDLGADVIRVESLGGDESRRWPPKESSGDDGCYFLSVNRSKRAIQMDAKSEEGREVLQRLIANADVLITNYRPQSLERLGLAVEKIREEFPTLIYATVTGFGYTGSRANEPAMDLLMQAAAGLMSMTGTEDGSVVKVPIPIVDLSASLYATIAIQSALRSREQTSAGCHVDVSLRDSLLSMLAYHATGYLERGDIARPFGTSHPGIAPYRAYNTADGQLILAVFTDQQFKRAATVIGERDLASRAGFAKVEDRVANREEIDRIFGHAIEQRPTAHWLDAMAAADVPCTPINDVGAALEDPSLKESGTIVSFPRADGAPPMRMVGSPIVFDSDRVQPSKRPPLVGHEAYDILAEIGFTKEQIRDLNFVQIE